MIRYEQQHAAGDRDAHARPNGAFADHQQRDRPEHHGCGKRDHREDAGQRAEQDRMRRAGYRVDGTHDRPFRDRDQHDAIHGGTDCLHGASQKAFHRRPEQAVADARYFSLKRIAVQINEIQRQQREDQRDDAPEHLCSQHAGQLEESRPRLRHRLGRRGRIAQPLGQLIVEPLPDPGKLLDPRGHLRCPALDRLGKTVHDGYRFAHRDESAVHDGNDQHGPEHESERERSPDVPPLAVKLAEPPVVQL